MNRSSLALAAIFAIVALTATAAQAAGPGDQPRDLRNNPAAGSPSGAYDFKDQQLGTGITECPQAGKIDEHPKPLDRRVKDEAEKVSNGNDRRVNQDYACFPQNETALDVNPTDNRNIVAGANDYRLGFGSSGFYASTDNGNHWYDGILPFPSLPSGDNLDGGGDPAIAFDRAGVVYYAEINFNRTDDVNGIFVMRSTNGGFT
ncbi:MAG: hypothetical protein M3R12_07145, partial [Actinomycetota bacterium]|nr:hypothetical protein [Actinomycetota bacterium]